MMDRKDALIRLFIERGVLRFGEFTLKSGRLSPYFFNLGALHTGAATLALGDAYAEAALGAGIEFDLVFGPAYKGIPLAVATAEALARAGRDTPWAFNRKEAKAHGEGGQFVGAAVAGRVLIVDDVLTAGTAVREATDLIQSTGAVIAGVVIALDRQERADGVTTTAVEALRETLGVPVTSILTLADILRFLAAGGLGAANDGSLESRIRAYQARYCVLDA
jgi:orotate phosphoribosyltransferase